MIQHDRSGISLNSSSEFVCLFWGFGVSCDPAAWTLSFDVHCVARVQWGPFLKNKARGSFRPPKATHLNPPNMGGARGGRQGRQEHTYFFNSSWNLGMGWVHAPWGEENSSCFVFVSVPFALHFLEFVGPRGKHPLAALAFFQKNHPSRRRVLTSLGASPLLGKLRRLTASCTSEVVSPTAAVIAAEANSAKKAKNSESIEPSWVKMLKGGTTWNRIIATIPWNDEINDNQDYTSSNAQGGGGSFRIGNL